MPTTERLRDAGLQNIRAHTTAFCSPTRQALLTGRNHHTVNMGAFALITTVGSTRGLHQ
jgi:arylsulfatase A-like enzyme